ILCESIVLRHVDPIAAAEVLWRIGWTLEPRMRELDPFIYAASEHEDRPGEREFWEEMILSQASGIVARFRSGAPAVQVDLTFAKGFSALATELRAEDAGYYYPGAEPYRAREGQAFEITPAGAPPGVAVFAPSILAETMRVTAFAAHPDGRHFGVANGGDAYVVSAFDPNDWQS